MDDIQRGRLHPPGSGPARGESIETLTALPGLSVEQILSGELEGPVDYLQDHDEWVVVLHGGASLVVGGTAVDLTAGEWLLLPRGAPHRLVRTEPGTSWLAVRASSVGHPVSDFEGGAPGRIGTQGPIGT